MKTKKIMANESVYFGTGINMNKMYYFYCCFFFFLIKQKGSEPNGNSEDKNDQGKSCVTREQMPMDR